MYNSLHKYSFPFWFGILFIGILFFRPSVVSAQTPFQVGDEVEFDFGDMVISGEVVESIGDGRILQIKAFFQGEDRVFRRIGKHVRHVGGPPVSEAKPQETPRTWTDASGKFSVEATLTGRENAAVQLLKADGSTIDVPVARLSMRDQLYLRSSALGAEASSDPVTIQAPSVPDPIDLPPGTPVEIVAVASPSPIPAADPAGDQITLAAPVTIGFPRKSLHTEWSTPLPADIEGGRVVFSKAYQRNNQPVTTVFLVDLKSRQHEPIAEWTGHRLRFLFSVPASDQVLASTNTGSLVLFDEVTSPNPLPKVHWKLPQNSQGKSLAVRRACLTPEGLAVVHCGKNVFIWDLNTKQCRWQLEKADGGIMAISPGGKYLAAQSGDRVGVFEIASGKQYGSIPLDNASSAGLAFSPDGIRLLVGHRMNIKVYDLKTWEDTSEMQLWDSRPYSYTVTGWLDDRNAMLADGLVVRPEENLVLWDYEILSRTREHFPTLHHGFFSCIRLESNDATLIAASLPHPSVPEVPPGDARPDLAIREGDSVVVRLDTAGAPMDISEFRAAIEKMLQRSGWKTGSTGKVVLEVQLHQTEEREVEYQRLFGGGPSHEKLKFAPWKTTLRLLRDGELLWEHAYTPSSPNDLMSKNQTMQKKLRLAEVPDTDFLDRITLHPYITLPEYQNGYGRSTFETSGISDHPASTGP